MPSFFSSSLSLTKATRACKGNYDKQDRNSRLLYVCPRAPYLSLCLYLYSLPLSLFLNKGCRSAWDVALTDTHATCTMYNFDRKRIVRAQWLLLFERLFCCVAISSHFCQLSMSFLIFYLSFFFLRSNFSFFYHLNLPYLLSFYFYSTTDDK